MISKKDILKMVRHVSKRSQGIPDRRLIHPRRDWVFGLTAFAVIVIVGVIYNMQVYNRYSNIESELETPTSGVVTYKENLVAETLEFYRAKKRLYEERVAQPADAGDAAGTNELDEEDTIISEVEEVVESEPKEVQEPVGSPEPVFE